MRASSGKNSAAWGLGAAVREVREVLHFDRTRVEITQAALYDLCHHAERAIIGRLKPGSRAPRRSFEANYDIKYVAKKIRWIELDEKRQARLTKHELEVLAEAFGLPASFFLALPPDRDALKAAYHAAMQPGAPSVVLSAASPALTKPVGFKQVGDQKQPSARNVLTERLHSAADPKDGPVLIVIEGTMNAGKSFFVSRWFHDQGREHFGGGAASIGCSGFSIDQYLPALELLQSRCGDLPRLIVFDDVSIEKFSDGPRPLNWDGPRPSLGDLVRTLNPLLEDAGGQTTIVVSLENNAKPLDESAFLQALAVGVRFRRLTVSPLSPDEGADFLLELGVEHFDRRALREISTLNMGMPSMLAAAAYEIARLTERGLETYLDRLRSGGDSHGLSGAHLVEGRLRAYLDRQRDAVLGPDDLGRHPYALLRLLSMMPGPIPLAHLEVLLNEGKITRLEKMRVEDIAPLELPYISTVDDRIDVHARVRALLRAELEASIAADVFQETTREELEWIHWRMAKLLWSVVKPRPVRDLEQDLDGPNLASVEAFVFHTMAQIGLIPQIRKEEDDGQALQSSRPKPTKVRRRTRAQSGVEPKHLDSFLLAAGELSNAVLWELAYQSIVKPVLFDRRYRMTRIHGQYEAKARILSYLAKAAEREAVPVHPSELATLYKEIAVCKMNAGRLLTAATTIRQAENILRAAFPNISDDVADRNKIPTHWPLYCDILSVANTIMSRKGEPAAEVARPVDDLFRTTRLVVSSRRASKDPAAPKGGKDYTPPAERGALRILTRRAELTLAMDGDVEGALQQFGEAAKLQWDVRDRTLDGEAAKRYVVALVRNRNPERMAVARSVVAANLDRYRSMIRGYGGMSADIVPFETLAAALDRIDGRIELARQRLQSVEEHEYVQRRDCTFVSMIELEFEKFRQAIVREDNLQQVYQAARALSNRLKPTHHLQMSNEALVLAAEAATGAERLGLVRQIQTQFSTTGWRLRLHDARELEQGRSAVMRFGL